MGSAPVIDVSAWIGGDSPTRDAIAAQVDDGMRTAGFLLVVGHGVTETVLADARAAAARFFALRPAVKDRYRTTVGGRGYLPLGVEANGYSAGVPTPPDLKESFVYGRERPKSPDTPTNVWPRQVPGLRAALVAFMHEAERVAMLLLEICGRALGESDDALTALCRRADFGCNINHYPSLAVTGAPMSGQYRIGPHSDFGTITVLDREPGVGALQIQTMDGDWVDAPYLPGALTINAGDLLSLWTGGRWRSTPHRVLPPRTWQADEELTSLVLFHTADADAVIAPLGADGEGMETVVAGDYLRRQLDSITFAAAPAADT